MPYKKSTEKAYKFRTSGNDTELDLSIEYDNFYLCASGSNQDSITFDPKGSVGIDGKTSDFNIEITLNEGYYSTDWYQLSVSGDSGTNPKLEITDKGYILSGEDLTDITIYAENTETANELNLKTEESKVLITQEGENLCVKSDEDKDDKYETVLVTGIETTPNDHREGGSSSINNFLFDLALEFGEELDIIDLWIIIIISGVVMVSIIVTVIIFLLHLKKKMNNDKFDILKFEIKNVNYTNILDDLAGDIVKDIKEDVAEIEENKEILSGIHILSGNMTNQKFEITDGQIAVIGKDPNLANIIFDDSYKLVSRVHCSITYSSRLDKYFIIDSSSNGVYLQNGRRFTKNKRISIARGSIIKLADDNCVIKLI